MAGSRFLREVVADFTYDWLYEQREENESEEDDDEEDGDEEEKKYDF